MNAVGSTLRSLKREDDVLGRLAEDIESFDADAFLRRLRSSGHPRRRAAPPHPPPRRGDRVPQSEGSIRRGANNSGLPAPNFMRALEKRIEERVQEKRTGDWRIEVEECDPIAREAKIDKLENLEKIRRWEEYERRYADSDEWRGFEMTRVQQQSYDLLMTLANRGDEAAQKIRTALGPDYETFRRKTPDERYVALKNAFHMTDSGVKTVSGVLNLSLEQRPAGDAVDFTSMMLEPAWWNPITWQIVFWAASAAPWVSMLATPALLIGTPWLAYRAVRTAYGEPAQFVRRGAQAYRSPARWALDVVPFLGTITAGFYWVQRLLYLYWIGSFAPTLASLALQRMLVEGPKQKVQNLLFRFPYFRTQLQDAGAAIERSVVGRTYGDVQRFFDRPGWTGTAVRSLLLATVALFTPTLVAFASQAALQSGMMIGTAGNAALEAATGIEGMTATGAGAYAVGAVGDLWYAATSQMFRASLSATFGGTFVEDLIAKSGELSSRIGGTLADTYVGQTAAAPFRLQAMWTANALSGTLLPTEGAVVGWYGKLLVGAMISAPAHAWLLRRLRTGFQHFLARRTGTFGTAVARGIETISPWFLDPLSLLIYNQYLSPLVQRELGDRVWEAMRRAPEVGADIVRKITGVTQEAAEGLTELLGEYLGTETVDGRLPVELVNDEPAALERMDVPAGPETWGDFVERTRILAERFLSGETVETGPIDLRAERSRVTRAVQNL